MTPPDHTPRTGRTGHTGRTQTALVMAGGTGGHIFPALALARELRARGWQVHWLGAPQSMEERLVTAEGFAFEAVQFSGVRGKAVITLALAPLKLLRALGQAWALLRRLRPDVVIGFGGYITVPGGVMAAALGKPLVLHEQNAIAGMANRVLAPMARRVFTAFAGVFPQGQWVGNPLRAAFLNQAAPLQRLGARQGPLQLLVVGGSLGARALNEVVPQALALLPEGKRPQVIHQSGAAHLAALQDHYARAGVQATLLPFIDDMASALAQADIVVCRAGASTVTEIAAVGVAAIFVPFPAAVDDHQTHNAASLVDVGGGWLLPQDQLTPQELARMLSLLERSTLAACAQKAKNMEKTQAVEAMARACEELAPTCQELAP